jgi:uncharacterized integral membrane protein
LRLFFWNVYAPLFVLVLTVFFLGAIVGFLMAKRGRKKEPKPEKGDIEHQAPST